MSFSYHRIISLLAFVTILLLGVQQGCQGIIQEREYCDQKIRQNRSNLATLQIGMTKDKVVKKMGTFTCGFLVNPWNVEAFSKGPSKYEVIYYVIRKRAFSPIKPKDQTPLVFKDERLIGWGNTFLGDFRHKMR